MLHNENNFENAMAISALSNIYAEQAVIGAVLVDNTAFDDCAKLTADMFFHLGHKAVWRAICDMRAADKAVDVVTLDSHLANCGGDGGNGMDLAYFADLQLNTASAANVGRYVQTVLDRFAERQMLQAGLDIQNLAVARDGSTVSDRQAKAVAMLTAIAEQAADVAHEMTYLQALKAAILRKQELMDMGDDCLLGFDTGLSLLNAKTYGLRRGDLTVIGGRPSMGKSVLAENIARHCAKNGLAVRFQSYEMSASDLTDRGAAAEKGIDYSVLRLARFSDEDWSKYNSYVRTASEWSLTLDTEMVGIDKLTARCRTMKRKQGLDLLVVDHLHLMPRLTTNEVQELDEITARLKRLAMELDIHVLLVAQLSRGVNGRENKRPSMSDIRGSGAIEQNANTIIFPYRDEYYNQGQSNPGEAELIIAKNRDGERCTIHVGWEGKHQRFTDEIPFWDAPRSDDKPAQKQHDPYRV